MTPFSMIKKGFLFSSIGKILEFIYRLLRKINFLNSQMKSVVSSFSRKNSQIRSNLLLHKPFRAFLEDGFAESGTQECIILGPLSRLKCNVYGANSSSTPSSLEDSTTESALFHTSSRKLAAAILTEKDCQPIEASKKWN